MVKCVCAQQAGAANTARAQRAAYAQPARARAPRTCTTPPLTPRNRARRPPPPSPADAVNDAPVLPATDLPLSTAEDTPLAINDTTLTSNVTDVDSSTFTVNITSGPTTGTLTRVNGGYIFQPELDSNATVEFTYTVTDDGTPALTSTTRARSSSPSVRGRTASGATGRGCRDPGVPPLHHPLAPPPSPKPPPPSPRLPAPRSPRTAPHAPPLPKTRTKPQQPTAPPHHPTHLHRAAAAVNDAPDVLVAGPTTSTPEDTPVNLTAAALTNAASDVDGDALVVGTITAHPANGVATVNADGTITYVPNPNFNGVDSFNYTLVDGNSGSVVVTATVTISAPPRAAAARRRSRRRCAPPLRHASTACFLAACASAGAAGRWGRMPAAGAGRSRCGPALLLTPHATPPRPNPTPTYPRPALQTW